MSSDAYTLALKRFAAGEAPVLCNELVQVASRLAEEIAGRPGTVAEGEEVLAPYSTQLDELLVPALVLIGSGTDQDLRAVSVAFSELAWTSAGPYRSHTTISDAVLARSLLCLIAGALAWHRTETVVMLAGLSRGNGSSRRVRVLADSSLRHLDVFNHNAGDSYQAHEAWLIGRPWRSAVGPLATDDQVRMAVAEADVLTGMLAVASDPREHPFYSAGLHSPNRQVEQRIIGRSVDVRQRAHLCVLFGVGDQELDERLESAYAGLTPNNRPTGFKRSLFHD